VDSRRIPQAPPEIDLSVFIVSRVCRALQYVFERAAIVHRDISPSNIMMTREGTVKLIDFGIATRSGTRDSALTGKPAYMAPEMVLELRADNRSDLFSLGTVFFELLTGHRLFTGASTTEVLEKVMAARTPSARELNPRLPAKVNAILKRALRRDPAARFASAGEMGEACEHYLYDKGYGPTNLSLKRYVARLFPEAVGRTASEESFPIVEPTLLPIRDGRPGRLAELPDGGTGVTPVRAYTRVITERPAITERSAPTKPLASPPAASRPRRRAAEAPARRTVRKVAIRVRGSVKAAGRRRYR
jgi:serine/threonine protein kinase